MTTETTEQADAAARQTSLRDMLFCRRWVLRRHPFVHVVATNVFRPAVYQQMVAVFRSYIADGSALRYDGKHDFYGAPLIPPLPHPLSVFMSAEFQKVFVDIFGVPTTGHTTGGAHRHTKGSRNGFPHNDISPERLSVVLPANEIADTGFAAAASADGDPETTVRALAILFYLNNGPWNPGDGGGTGLYRHWGDDVARPAAVAPPIDNSLLAFECSPYSYHGFITNRNRRDSIIVFLYRSLESYLAQWGVDGLSQFADA
jgi:hypothetical protein